MLVALFVTCFNDTLFPGTAGPGRGGGARAAGRAGGVPAGATCCGQMHFNTGYRPECTGMVRHFHRTVAETAGDDGLADAVRQVSPRVHELSSSSSMCSGLTTSVRHSRTG